MEGVRHSGTAGSGEAKEGRAHCRDLGAVQTMRGGNNADTGLTTGEGSGAEYQARKKEKEPGGGMGERFSCTRVVYRSFSGLHSDQVALTNSPSCIEVGTEAN